MKQTTGFNHHCPYNRYRYVEADDFFSQIFHHQVKIYRWTFNSLPAYGDYCRLLINFANGLVPDQA